MTYIINVRNGGSSSGYISTGFWAGSFLFEGVGLSISFGVRAPEESKTDIDLTARSRSHHRSGGAYQGKQPDWRTARVDRLCPPRDCVSPPPLSLVPFSGQQSLTPHPIPRLEFIVWFDPSLISDAIAVACIGLLLGPMYPVAMNHAGRVLPQWLLTGALGWIAGGGQAGSALIPFITGAIAQKAGIGALQPVYAFPSPSVCWMVVNALIVVRCFG